MDNGEAAIQIEALALAFGGVEALKGLTLSVPRGIVFGFLGPNGAGKTSTLRLLLGLVKPSSGKASVLGFDLRTDSERIRASTGALLEANGLYERMSAEDNLELYGRIFRMRAADRRARAKDLLTRLGLWERRRDPAGALSRGMKQRLAVARALFHHPALVFLDEPTSGLDPVAAAAFRDDMAALTKREGVTVFLNTHNLAEAERLCSRLAVIRGGELLAVGSPDELRFRESAHQVEVVGRGFTAELLSLLRELPEVASAEAQNGRLILRLRGDRPAAPLVSLIIRRGGEVEEVRRGTASLEEAFLAMMAEEGQ
jgi:ABC-2 type transport system ATP-binding protein